MGVVRTVTRIEKRLYSCYLLRRRAIPGAARSAGSIALMRAVAGILSSGHTLAAGQPSFRRNEACAGKRTLVSLALLNQAPRAHTLQRGGHS